MNPPHFVTIYVKATMRSCGDAAGRSACLVGVAAGAIIWLYQIGIIKHLSDPPLPDEIDPFDSDQVDASDHAYKRADTPDGLIMFSYQLTPSPPHWPVPAGQTGRIGTGGFRSRRPARRFSTSHSQPD